MSDEAEIARARARAMDLDQQFGDVRTGAPTRSATTTGMEMMLNVGPSALNYARDIVGAVAHPLDTIDAVQDLAQGAVRRFYGDNPPAFVDPNTDTRTFDATAQYFKDRYGGVENWKRTMAQDPVGMAADVSTMLTGGGAAASRAPGAVGRAGQVVQRAGELTDPLTVAGNVAKGGARGAGEIAAVVSGTMTGAGPRSIKEAARIGFGDDVEKQVAFLTQLRDKAPATDIVKEAREGLQTLRQERAGAYERQMGLLKQNNARLDYQPVIDAWNRIQQSFLVDGNLSRIGERTQGTMRQVGSVIEQWARTPEAHTVAGLDALKRRVRDEVGSFNSLSPDEQRVVTDMANEVKNVIVQQSPEYAQIMRQYETESKMIDEYENTLSLGRTARVDTTLRKLISALRSNANTNFGARTDLVDELDARGNVQTVPSVAGRQLQQWHPGGLQSIVAGGTLAAGIADPKVLAALPFQSPRVAGEAAYGGGAALRETNAALRAAGVTPGAVRTAGMSAFQGGRLRDQRTNRLLQAAEASNLPPSAGGMIMGNAITRAAYAE